MRNFLKKKFVSVFIVSILLLSFLAPSFLFLSYPQKAEAFVTVGGTPLAPPVITACHPFLDWDCLKTAALDTAAKIIVRTLIRGLTNSIIAWIQGNGGANVGFVGNFEQEFRRQVDLRGGEFLNQVAGINLCGDIGAFLQISLRTNAPSLRQRLECSVTDIVENVNDFFTDFSNGGWPAFIRISQEHQNNPYGANWIALNAKLQVEASAVAGWQQRTANGNGFQGWLKKVDAKCEKGGIDEGSLQCYTEYVIKTPGKLISDLLTDAGISGPRAASTAKEFDEAIAAIINALINKLIGSVENGIFDPGLSDLPVDYKKDKKYGVLIITNDSHLPAGVVGTPYSIQLNATGGVAPYKWELLSGAIMPPGLTFSADGKLSGTPTAEGIYSLLLQATDKVKTTVLDQFIITINASNTTP